MRAQRLKGNGKGNAQREPERVSQSSPRIRDGRPTCSNRWKAGYLKTENQEEEEEVSATECSTVEPGDRVKRGEVGTHE